MRNTSVVGLSRHSYGYGLGLGAFFLLGMGQALYGPALPYFQERFALDTARVGWLISAHFAGMVMATLASGQYLRRGGYRFLILTGLACLTLGGAGLCAAPLWPLALASAFSIGLGFGTLNTSFSLLVGDMFVARRAAALNVLSAMLGLGAILGPLLIILAGPALAFLVVALLSLIVLAVAGPLKLSFKYQENTRKTGPTNRYLLTGFILLYLTYVGCEAGIGSWGATHLLPLVGGSKAALFTSLFWSALMVGRFLTVPVSLRVQPHRLIVGSLLLAIVAIVFAYQNRLAPYAYVVAGLALAPIFPTGLAWIRQVFPEAATRVTSLALVSAAFGGVIFPPLIGIVVRHQTTTWIPGSIAAVMLACLCVALALGYLTFRHLAAEEKVPPLPTLTPGGRQDRLLRARRVETKAGVTTVHHPLVERVMTSQGGEAFRNDVCWHGFVLTRTLLETVPLKDPTVVVFPRGGVATGVGAKLALRGTGHHFFTVKLGRGTGPDAKPATLPDTGDLVLVDGIIASGTTLLNYLEEVRQHFKTWRGRLFVISNLAAEQGIKALEAYTKRYALSLSIVTGLVIPDEECAWKELDNGKRVYFIGVNRSIGDFGDMASLGLAEQALLTWRTSESLPIDGFTAN